MPEGQNPPRPTVEKDLVISSALEDESIGLLSSPISRIAAELAGEGAFSAPVLLPSREELTVRLVPVALLQQLDELRGEANLLQSLFWTDVGSLLGYVLNLVTSSQSVSQIDITTGVVTFFLILGGGVFRVLWSRAERRAEKLRAKIFKEAIPQR